MPEYATEHSAAVDLRAALDGKSVRLAAHSTVSIPTGVAIAPEGHDVVSILASRGGLAAKHGIQLVNGIGVIDSDYRGEICAVLHNTSDEDYTIEDGERVAQLFFVPVLHGNFIKAEELDTTERGVGGFGSTGKF